MKAAPVTTVATLAVVRGLMPPAIWTKTSPNPKGITR